MNKLEQLEVAIRSLPDQYNVIRNVLLNLVLHGELATARSYSLGLLDASLHLTDDKALIGPLQTIRGIL